VISTINKSTELWRSEGIRPRIGLPTFATRTMPPFCDIALAGGASATTSLRTMRSAETGTAYAATCAGDGVVGIKRQVAKTNPANLICFTSMEAHSTDRQPASQSETAAIVTVSSFVAS
jgi:hypothetical protein